MQHGETDAGADDKSRYIYMAFITQLCYIKHFNNLFFY
jgi:hypothetical protein